MAEYFVVMFNFGNELAETGKIRKVFDSFKDWLKVSSQNWIVYTSLSASEIRDRLVEALQPDPPSIIVLSAEIKNWSAYAKNLSRDWLRKQRSPDTEGE